MKKILISAAAVAMLAFSPAAFAQAETDNSFATADSDKSGDVSLAELTLIFTDYDQARFDALDADKSGGLSEEEYQSIDGGPESLIEDNGTDGEDVPAM